MDVVRMRDWVIDAYERSSEDEKQEGINWYPLAYQIAKEIHPSASAGAAVIAVLSPNISWTQNVNAAETICKYALAGHSVQPTVAGYGLNGRKAWTIAKSELGDSPKLNTWPGYYKVNNFYRNIMGDVEAVTIDRWAYRVCAPDVKVDAVKGKRYLQCERAYQLAAKHLGVITPRDLQATVWIRERNLSTTNAV
jgi:hypothetical protein